MLKAEFHVLQFAPTVLSQVHLQKQTNKQKKTTENFGLAGKTRLYCFCFVERRVCRGFETQHEDDKATS